MKQLKDAEILICGTARNIEKTLLNDYNIISASFSIAKAVHWLIIESDSSDDTLDLLSNLKATNHNFHYISLGNLSKEITSRVERICFCRNIYLAELQKPNNISYLVVADLDGTNSLLTKEAVLTCWSRNDWDVCTANQDGPYYDIYALRHPSWQSNDCLQEYEFLSAFSKNVKQVKFASIYSKMITIPANSEWIEVDSAFGGLAIYKTHLLKGLCYDYADSNGKTTCEHVALHKKIRERGGRILINPKLINCKLNEHSSYRLKLNGLLRIR